MLDCPAGPFLCAGGGGRGWDAHLSTHSDRRLAGRQNTPFQFPLGRHVLSSCCENADEPLFYFGWRQAPSGRASLKLVQRVPHWGCISVRIPTRTSFHMDRTSEVMLPDSVGESASVCARPHTFADSRLLGLPWTPSFYRNADVIVSGLYFIYIARIYVGACCSDSIRFFPLFFLFESTQLLFTPEM